MANGVYGTNIPTAFQNNEITKYVDIFYSYSETQNSSDVEAMKLKKIDSSNLTCTETDSEDAGDNVVEGLYNLKLPMNIFGKKGFYTIYIKPKEIPATILDVSTLKDHSNIRGIVLDIKSFTGTEFYNDVEKNNGLVGYRIIYKDDTGKRTNETRFITSNNRCQPVVSVSTSTNAQSYTYQYKESATYTFITVTPSSALSYKPSSTPFIGKATQQIYLVNTFFEPVQLDIEMVEEDAETITTLLSGSQLRDLNNGIITTFDKNGNIVAQSEVSTLKESATGTPQYEVKEDKSNNIDFSQTLSDKL